MNVGIWLYNLTGNTASGHLDCEYLEMKEIQNEILRPSLPCLNGQIIICMSVWVFIPNPHATFFRLAEAREKKTLSSTPGFIVHPSFFYQILLPV
ncbi:hypothetical protein AVEN_244021-1 [Araneus ventricosus]|uniref:Uncharacterized protein n=1 Tax=Araneus ventricosus TaxID=182803 RepID=A0A4Y2SJM6_ARAVE|nr:hypothetical protein AVEN_244021-1 [Araneus ventricosus]